MKESAPNEKIIRVAALLMGAFFSFLGLLTIASVTGFMSSQTSAVPSNLAFGYFAAVIFTTAGFAMMLFGLNKTAAAAKLGVIALLSFVLAFNWIAFGPGERRFHRKSNTSWSSSTAAPVSEFEGRAVFGGFALLMDGVLIYVLIKSRKPKP